MGISHLSRWGRVGVGAQAGGRNTDSPPQRFRQVPQQRRARAGGAVAADDVVAFEIVARARRRAAGRDRAA